MNRKRLIIESAVTFLISNMMDSIADWQKNLLKNDFEHNEHILKLDKELSGSGYVHHNISKFVKYSPRQDWSLVSPRLHKRKSPRSLLLKYLAVVAILAGVMFLLHIGNSLSSVSSYDNLAGLAVFAPGHNQAELKLDDGRIIKLNNAEDLVLQEAKVVNGKLEYGDSDELGEAKWHTVNVPRGGEYKIVLPDKTIVTMNSESKLYYPNQFDSDTREVELEGEAYFEVSEDAAKPFIVKTGNIKIQVMGTSFNVKAYPDECMQTTLVEGSIYVLTESKSLKIRPGQQLTIIQDTLAFREVDIKSIIAGKDSRFVFDDEPLADVMKKLERWYNVEIIIADESLRKMNFTGNLPKYQNLSKVLELLALTTHIRFNLQNNSLIVEHET